MTYTTINSEEKEVSAELLNAWASYCLTSLREAQMYLENGIGQQEWQAFTAGWDYGKKFVKDLDKVNNCSHGVIAIENGRAVCDECGEVL